MVPIGDPKTWVSYWNTRDCSQGFCSLYCPQWCYNNISPSTSPLLHFHDQDYHHSGPKFSSLFVAIVAILVSGLLLLSYYIIMSKYCRRRNTDRPNTEENYTTKNVGLGEDQIKSITIVKYTRGGGGGESINSGADCSICLSEFQEDETLRLLPKCSHVFHVFCIDKWLQSHSDCPLCGATISSAASPPPSRSRNENEETESPAASGFNQNPEIRRAFSSVLDRGRLSVADILRVDDEDHYCDRSQDSQLRHTLSLSRARFLIPKLNRGQQYSMIIPL